MLLAPFALTDSPRSGAPQRRHRRKPAVATPATHVPTWLVTWAVLGALIVLCVPGARGGGFGGATLPFWLAVAPWIDIAWLTRRRWRPALSRRPR